MRNLVGKRYGRLTVVSLSPQRTSWGATRWICRCDCGEETTVAINNLGTSTNSCGCIRNTQGGISEKHPFYNRWSDMIDRCSNPRHPAYLNYGARGISVCERWQSFPDFLSDMESSYFPGATLDRKDNDLGYSPENCRWATPKQQSVNTRRNVRIETPWGLLTYSEAAEKAGMPRWRLRGRVILGWTSEQLFDPKNRGPVTKWSRRGAQN